MKPWKPWTYRLSNADLGQALDAVHRHTEFTGTPATEESIRREVDHIAARAEELKRSGAITAQPPGGLRRAQSYAKELAERTRMLTDDGQRTFRRQAAKLWWEAATLEHGIKRSVGTLGQKYREAADIRALARRALSVAAVVATLGAVIAALVFAVLAASSSSSTALALIIMAGIFIMGAAVGLVAVVSIGIRHEQQRFAQEARQFLREEHGVWADPEDVPYFLCEEAPDGVRHAARRFNGLYIRQLPKILRDELARLLLDSPP